MPVPLRDTKGDKNGPPPQEPRGVRTQWNSRIWRLLIGALTLLAAASLHGIASADHDVPGSGLPGAVTGGTAVPPGPSGAVTGGTAVPTLPEWGTLLLATLLAGLAWRWLRRQPVRGR